MQGANHQTITAHMVTQFNWNFINTMDSSAIFVVIVYAIITGDHVSFSSLMSAREMWPAELVEPWKVYYMKSMLQEGFSEKMNIYLNVIWSRSQLFL